jgi:hypothetical protein
MTAFAKSSGGNDQKAPQLATSRRRSAGGMHQRLAEQRPLLASSGERVVSATRGTRAMAPSFDPSQAFGARGNNKRNRSNEEQAFDQYGCAIGGSCLGVSPKHARRRRATRRCGPTLAVLSGQ